MQESWTHVGILVTLLLGGITFSYHYEDLQSCQADREALLLEITDETLTPSEYRRLTALMNEGCGLGDMISASNETLFSSVVSDGEHFLYFQRAAYEAACDTLFARVRTSAGVPEFTDYAEYQLFLALLNYQRSNALAIPGELFNQEAGQPLKTLLSYFLPL